MAFWRRKEPEKAPEWPPVVVPAPVVQIDAAPIHDALRELAGILQAQRAIQTAPEVVERLAAVEFGAAALRRELNSLRSRVYRDLPAQKDAEHVGIAPLPVSANGSRAW